MKFALTAEHVEMRDALRDMLARDCTTAVVRAAAHGNPPVRLWSQLAELGALNAVLPAEAGGVGVDGVGFVLLAEETGYVALPAPFVEHAGVVVPALMEAGIEIPSAGEGFAYSVPCLGDAGPSAWAAGATHLLSDHQGDLILLENTPGTMHSAGNSLDESRPLASLEAVSSGRHVGGPDAAAVAFDRGALGTAAQLIGLGRRMLDMSLQHVLTRNQFGVPIGSFQALKHRLADAKTSLEYATSQVLAAAWTLEHRPERRQLTVSMAKSSAGKAVDGVGRTALQCHGAMGYSEEFDLQLFLKRSWALTRSWGTTPWHSRRITEHLAQETPDDL